MKCVIRSVMQCGDGGCISGNRGDGQPPIGRQCRCGQRLIGGAATGRTVKIVSVSRDSERLMLYGTELGVGWTVAISEDSG